MKGHIIPFENRWTSGERAWQWHCELEWLGVATVRAMYCEHEAHYSERPTVVFGIPSGFVRDWLAFHDRREVRLQFFWRTSVVALGVIAALASVLSALK